MKMLPTMEFKPKGSYVSPNDVTAIDVTAKPPRGSPAYLDPRQCYIVYRSPNDSVVFFECLVWGSLFSKENTKKFFITVKSHVMWYILYFGKDVRSYKGVITSYMSKRALRIPPGKGFRKVDW